MTKYLLGDCYDILPTIQDGSIDLILTDPPYNVTDCKWDCPIDLSSLWTQFKRILKPSGAVIITATQPFTTTLINSNPKWFRYDLVWLKTQGTGFYNANRMPLRGHEDILVFYNKLPVYHPQKTPGKPYKAKRGSASEIYQGKDLGETNNETGDRYPLSYLYCQRDKTKHHPTQKPIGLFEWLIRTYTNEGDTVLDTFAGVGTTAIACMNTNRKYLCIEKETKYYEIGLKRIENASLA